MNSVPQDQVIGQFHGVKGPLKQIARKPGDNPKLEGEGSAEKIAGNVQDKLDQFKNVLARL